jgi:hypothetical protein
MEHAEDNEFIRGMECLFRTEVYHSLPKRLQELVELIENRPKQDVALQGIITALSAAYSRWRFYHGSGSDVKEYSPHLLSLTVGAAGSGKGLTRYGYKLVEMVIHHARERQKLSLQKYKTDKSEYDRQRRHREKNNLETDDLREPEKPPKFCFGMSASDTTQAALVEILYNNPIGGFAYDSEIDTMVQGNAKKEFGGFGDIIRKTFHHEPLSRQRKGEGESYVVEQPRLAVMLSGTRDQLRKLIPSEYNGLFSRLWYYIIPDEFQEYKPATQQRDIVGEACLQLQQYVSESADLWSDQLHYLSFSEKQERSLLDAMQDKRNVEINWGGDISASWLRLPLITKRIAVTLAAFEGCTVGYVPTHCWNCAMGILKTMKRSCLEAVDIIRENSQGKIDIPATTYRTMHAGGMSDVSIAAALGISSKTLQRRKKQWDLDNIQTKKIKKYDPCDPNQMHL